MDFVDLDKVLDEFEEEEKAAEDITPGRETKPSGYAEYIQSHLDKPWETLSTVPIGKPSVTSINDNTNIILNYDDPYHQSPDKLDYNTTNQINPIKKLEQLGLDNVDYSEQGFDRPVNDIIVTNIEYSTHHPVLNDHIHTRNIEYNSIPSVDDSSLQSVDNSSIQSGSNSGLPSLDTYSLPSVGNSSLSSQSSLKLMVNGDVKHESKSRLLASQVTAVQTDALSPNSELEFSSYPYPKSDIIVEGHDTVNAGEVKVDVVESVLNSKQIKTSDLKKDSIPALVNSSHQNVHQISETAKELTKVYQNGNSQCSVDNESLHSNELKGKIDSLDIPKVIGFGMEDTDVTPSDMDDYLNDLAKQMAAETPQLSQSLGSELIQAEKSSLPSEMVSPRSLSYSSHDQPALSSMIVKEKTPTSLSDELQQATNGLSDDQKEGSPCRDAGSSPDVVPKDEVYSSMEGAVGHSPECSSLERPNFVQEKSPNTLDYNRKGIVSDINISLTQDGDCLEIEQIINEPISLSEYDISCEPINHASKDHASSSGFVSEMPSVPREKTGKTDVSLDSDYHSGMSMDSVIMRNHDQAGIGQGARPKEPNHVKRGRPSSLLGLSKVNLEAPFSGTHVVDSSPEGNQNNVSSSGSSSVVNDSINSDQHTEYQNHVENNSSNVNSLQRGGQGFSQNSENTTGLEDLPVLRRNLDVASSSNGMASASRPHSWSPGGNASPQMNKSKRPSSLNLPPRGEFNPDDPGIVPCRTRGVLTPYPEQSEENETPQEDTVESNEEEVETEGAIADELNLEPEQSDVAETLNPVPIIQTSLGMVAPDWLPDSEALNCMQCQARFTFTKRRHHCRACGKIFCSLCCSMKSKLVYMENKEARVCLSCHQILQAAEKSDSYNPHPNNPSDYCSTVPISQQLNPPNSNPTVLVPSGVLKRDGTQRRSAEPKQVMFSDGIRPGGDLTELDGSNDTSLPFRRTGRIQKKVEKQGGQSSPKTRRVRNTNNQRNLIPDDGLPPLYTKIEGTSEGTFEDSLDPVMYMPQIKDEESEPVIFAVNKNLFILVKMLNLDCCVKRSVWCFTSRGMCTVGQNEIIILLEVVEDELSPPRDIFMQYSNIYEEASKGNVINDLGYSIFNQNFLGNREHGGFLYITPTFQCLQKLILPEPPYLIGILLQKWETPWAKVFPLRLLLRLGAEFRYYPCPLVSIRNRKPVFFEIGHTIMNLLADFRNYQYMLPQNRGVFIHMEDKKTVISFPRNRYDDLMKVVNNSNEHVMALGASFSTEADSHLVCIQSEEGNYQTQAINIQNKVRKVTGASFVVFNGALKPSSGLTAKSSIVEDGLMVQITLESMNALKEAIKNMLDYTIACGSMTSPQPEELICIQWVEEDRIVNMGVKSPIDGMSMSSVESIRVHKATDYVGENRSIRWTEVFFIQNEDTGSRWEPVDLSRLGEMLASSFCIAMTPHLDRLKEASLTKLGLRVRLDSESVGYEIGGNNEKLPDFYMNDLDSALIPVIHGAASQNQDGPIVMELIFHVLD